ncbi:TspB protein, partial [Neisseria cinerea]|nr:TspB protein [Neisseria cinerea]
MNEPRNRIFNSSNSRNVCSVVVAAFGIQTVTVPFAFADVAMPPPAQHQNASFPSEQALRNMGYNPDTGVWRVNAQNTGRAEVKSDGATITGSQPKTVTATGVHGEKAVINTKQTQSVNINRLETVAGGTLAGLTAAGGAIGSDFAASAYKSAKEGDWGGFARDAFGAVLEGLSKLDFTGLGGGINQFLDKTGIREGASAAQLNQASAKAAAAQAQAERAGDFRAAVANAA